jgi:hypothetical protein
MWRTEIPNNHYINIVYINRAFACNDVKDAWAMWKGVLTAICLVIDPRAKSANNAN